MSTTSSSTSAARPALRAHEPHERPASPDASAHQTDGRAWLVLFLAGAFEVGYALSVGGSEGFTIPGWSIAAGVFFLLTLLALSIALRSIDVGIGYAVWAGIGAVGAALLGPVLFDESLTAARAFWLAVIIGGVVWLKLADGPQEAAEGPGPAGDSAA